MRFYLDIVAENDPEVYSNQIHAGYRYHVWDSDSVTRFWAANTQNPFLRDQFYPENYWEDFLRFGAGHLPLGRLRVADVGCGAGTLLRVWDRMRSRDLLYGIDLSTSSIEAARRGVAQARDAVYMSAAFPSLPVADGTLDVVLATEVLEHLPSIADFSAAFYEAARVLRPGGIFLATVPLGEKCTFVVSPDTQLLFTPYQHMIFEISEHDLKKECDRAGLRLEAFHAPVNRSPAPSRILDFLKQSVVIPRLPAVARRLWAMAGVNGFAARRL